MCSGRSRSAARSIWRRGETESARRQRRRSSRPSLCALVCGDPDRASDQHARNVVQSKYYGKDMERSVEQLMIAHPMVAVRATCVATQVALVFECQTMYLYAREPHP